MKKGIVRFISAMMTTVFFASSFNVFASAPEELLKGAGGNHPNNRYVFDPQEYTVRTGKDNGFSGSNSIGSNDPHSGWTLGEFYIEGFTDIIEVDGEIIVLKNVGDEISFGYTLNQNISRLNSDSTLSINNDTNNTDTALGIPSQDFGQGALIVKQTNYQGPVGDPVVYQSFLAGCSRNADTNIDMYEEGDYTMALDYEIKDGRNVFGQTSFFGHDILPTYTDYRYSFSFKIRNSNCMAYPMDVETENELMDGDITPNGFTLDLARSRYLYVNVKYSQLNNGRPVVRENVVAADGDQYVESGIYEITVNNEYTTGMSVAAATKITIFVGDDPELLAYYRLFLGVPEEVTDTETEDLSAVESTENWLDSVKMSDGSLREYIEDNVYVDLVSELGPDYVVETVSTRYLSQQYLDNLEFNSTTNRYFGYTLDELDEFFEGERYVFTVDENNQTVAVPLETYANVDIYDAMISNVVQGAGVILVCVTISYIGAAAGASGAAVHAIFAVAADSGAKVALSTAAISGATTMLVRGYETGDFSLALGDAMVSAAEGFRIGAISGAVAGGLGETFTLAYGGLNGLTMNEVAILQQESGWPMQVIRNIHSMEEYEIYREAGLVAERINGKWTLTQPIDWDFEWNGMTNAERVMSTRPTSPVDSSGYTYELHHVGQQDSSPLAALTYNQHRSNAGVFNWRDGASQVDHGRIWSADRNAYWRNLLQHQNPELYASLL